MNVTCLSCGNEFKPIGASYDGLGWHTVCIKCESSFDIELPNYSEKLQELFDYCRVTEIVVNNGYLNIIYHCVANSDRCDTVDTCMDCHKIGCHIHTVAQDAEMVLNGEKYIEDIH